MCYSKRYSQNPIVSSTFRIVFVDYPNLGNVNNFNQLQNVVFRFLFKTLHTNTDQVWPFLT